MKIARMSLVPVWHGQVDQVCRTSPMFGIQTDLIVFSCKMAAYLDILCGELLCSVLVYRRKYAHI